MRLSLVIPAHDEARRIEPTLRAYAAELGEDAELIVVANHCSDATETIARRTAAELPRITVIAIHEDVGKGGAVRAGWRLAEGDYVGFADADLATPPADVRKVLAAAERRDGAIGSRWLPQSRVIGRTAGRNAAGRMFAALVRALFGLPFVDTQCGIKIVHRRFLAGYLERARVRDLAFDVELLLVLRALGARVEEVPTTWQAQPGSATLGTPYRFARQALRMVRSLVVLAVRERGWRRDAPRSVGG